MNTIGRPSSIFVDGSLSRLGACALWVFTCCVITLLAFLSKAFDQRATAGPETKCSALGIKVLSLYSRENVVVLKRKKEAKKTSICKMLLNSYFVDFHATRNVTKAFNRSRMNIM